MTERRPFDPNHFVETLRKQGRAAIVTPGGATVDVTVERERGAKVKLDSPVVYRCRRCNGTLRMTVGEGLGIRVREAFAFLENHKHTKETAS